MRLKQQHINFSLYYTTCRQISHSPQFILNESTSHVFATQNSNKILFLKIRNLMFLFRATKVDWFDMNKYYIIYIIQSVQKVLGQSNILQKTHRIKKQENTCQIFFKNRSSDTKLDSPPPPPGSGCWDNFEILNRNPHFLLQIWIFQKKYS